MARIELRHTTIYFQDGFGGSGQVDDEGADLDAESTSMSVDELDTNAPDEMLPVGGRFTVVGSDLTYTITARTPASAGPTTSITFSPALGSDNVPSDEAVITFLPQRVEIKVGEGNLTYTENAEFEYDLDRGELDTVRQGDEQPMDVNIDLVYEFISTGTNEDVTPGDAIKGRRGASEWISSSPDPCEPYSIDIVVEHEPPCGVPVPDSEHTVFPMFRAETFNPDLGEATISVTGRTNASEPIVTRVSPS